MMMKIAGGPGLVSPLDYGERKKPLPRATAIAVGVVVLAHIGVGAALYYQKFELTPTEATPEERHVIVTMDRPVIPPDPEKPQPQEPRPATNTLHTTPAPTLPTETFVADTLSKPSSDPGPVIDFAQPRPVEQPGTAVEPPRTPPVITRPQWASQPSAAQMGRAYPERALQDGVSGSASLICTVSAAGALSNCAVTSESPSNRRFGSAALGLTRYFRMQPGAVNGQAIDGARVSFSVRFAAGD
jgi:protein TonB